MNVVARLSSSLCRVNRSHRTPRLRVRRRVTFQSSWKKTPTSQLRQWRTFSANDGVGFKFGLAQGGAQIPGSTPAFSSAGASAAKNNGSKNSYDGRATLN